jgi:hypothetical protein
MVMRWLLCCASSRLSRHVIGFASRSGVHWHWVSLDASRLRLLAQRMPQMERMDCRIVEPLTDSMPIDFGGWTRMKHLQLRLGRRHSKADRKRLNVITAIAERMPLLHSLSLQLPKMQQEDNPPISFRPLAASSSLRSFTLQSSSSSHNFSPTQLSDLRALHWLHELHVPLYAEEWKQLLRPPMIQLGRAQLHILQSPSSPLSRFSFLPMESQSPILQWRSLQVPSPHCNLIDMDNEMAQLMGQLPQLTRLRARLTTRTPFLHSLTQLRELHLSEEGEEEAAVDPAEAESAAAGRARPLLELQHCPQLTTLALSSFPALDSELLAAVLPYMSQLTRLHLIFLPNLSSLRFLATPALAASLTDLNFFYLPSCPWSEAIHVHDLHSLRSLRLRLHGRVPVQVRVALTPPLAAALFPQLTHVELVGEDE